MIFSEFIMICGEFITIYSEFTRNFILRARNLNLCVSLTLHRSGSTEATSGAEYLVTAAVTASRMGAMRTTVCAWYRSSTLKSAEQWLVPFVTDVVSSAHRRGSGGGQVFFFFFFLAAFNT
jgi:hypothetical protein